MGFFRNAEIRRTMLIFLLIASAATVAAMIWDVRFGIFTLALCLLLGALQFISTFRRYRRIAELSRDIDKILHGSQMLSLDRYAEGELAILQSEIYKMTVRLREQQERLAGDKRFLADSIADISHQIRTPLTSIHLVLSFLSESGLSEMRRKELLQELYELIARIDWLISALLKISKLDTGTVVFHKESLPLEQLVRKACEPLLVPIELRGQQLQITASGNFSGDVAWTAEALTNIVKNCMEHTPQDGIITVAAEENTLYSQITVSDNGPGIAKEDLPHIFERFYKGKNSDEKSVGIGLALARMIVTMQDGTVKAENQQPHGARFTLRFYRGK